MNQNGKTLSMHNDAIWKGTYTHNGILLKIHENDYTIGYSAMLSPDGATAGVVKFGNGVFYDATEKDNKVYVGAPTADDAVAVFAGIIAREPGVASGYPVKNDEVASYQKGLLVKEGYLEYKEAYVASEGAVGSKPVNVYDNTVIGNNMYVRATDGVVYFGTAKVTGTDVLAGKIVSVNPDDKSVTVYISPVITA